jgi:hypothetical protein
VVCPVEVALDVLAAPRKLYRISRDAPCPPLLFDMELGFSEGIYRAPGERARSRYLATSRKDRGGSAFSGLRVPRSDNTRQFTPFCSYFVVSSRRDHGGSV